MALKNYWEHEDTIWKRMAINSETTWDTVDEYIVYGFLPICGCGSPDVAIKYIIDSLEDSNIRDKPMDRELNDTPERLFFLYWANDKDLMEHGSSVYGSWLTAKGESLVEELKRINTEWED